MSFNETIEAPQFEQIKKGNFRAINDAIRLLWFVANDEASTRRKAVKIVADRLSPKVLTITAGGNNVDLGGAGIVIMNSGAGKTVTGILSRVEGDVVFLHNIGAGSFTFNNQDASSDAGNRIVIQGAVNRAVATDTAIVLQYLNSRWREMRLA